jgi:hypothetical protein
MFAGDRGSWPQTPVITALNAHDNDRFERNGATTSRTRAKLGGPQKRTKFISDVSSFIMTTTLQAPQDGLSPVNRSIGKAVGTEKFDADSMGQRRNTRELSGDRFNGTMPDRSLLKPGTAQ